MSALPGKASEVLAADVANHFGLKKHPRSWRGQCPVCEYAGSTLSVRAASDGRPRLFCANGCTRDELVAAVERATGQPASAPRLDANATASRERKREFALSLWRGSEPARGTPAEVYLAARGLPGSAASPAIRYRSDTRHPEGGWLPAMIALVSDVAGQPIAVHRTFITIDGRNAAVEPTKASLGPIWGGAIRLSDLNERAALVIGEGIETAASAGRLLGLPAWAAISAGNLAKGLMLPPAARCVVIAADPDAAGRDAARAAWLRWRAEGRTVQIATPNGLGDFNDLLRAREAGNG